LVVWCFFIKPSRELAFPLARPGPLAVLGALLVVFGVTPLAELVGRLVERFVGADLTATQIITKAARGASGAELVLLLVAVAVLPAIVEEGMFRGLLTATFSRVSVFTGVIVPSVLFGIIHFEPTQVAATSVLGVGFALARLYTGSLLPCILAHGIYNFAVVITLRHADIGAERAFSPVSLVVGALLVAAGIFLLRRGRRGTLSSQARAETPLPPPA
jgi:membrane protease YdiL (CAAX protease family)